MGEFPVPLLTADDPQNALPQASRERIIRARLESELIRHKVVSHYAGRQRVGALIGPLDDALRHSPEFREASIESIRIVLRAMWAEFNKLLYPRRKMWEIMRWEIDAAINSYEMHDYPVTAADRQSLEMETMLWPVESENRAAETIEVSNPARFARRAQWLNEQLRAREWTARDLAQNSVDNLDPKTVHKILAGKESVRPDVLKKVIRALNNHPDSKRLGKVQYTDIPTT